MNQVLIGIIVIAILICFFNREQFTTRTTSINCSPDKNAERDFNNSANVGCVKLDTVDTDYFLFKNTPVTCKNNKKGATVKSGGCPKNPNGTYKTTTDGLSGGCAAGITSRTGNVLICS